MTGPDATPSRYLPQLDGARALAVLAVVLHHYGIYLDGRWDWGPIGPVVFFMLSGYLVTKSMMKLRERDGWIGEVTHFHFRRFCRLLPVLYIMIGAGVLVGLPEYTDHWAWHAGLATNFLVVVQNDWVGASSHLWSLGVQEQFYILWPFLLLLVPKRFLAVTVIGIALSGFLWRAGCIVGGASPFVRWFLLPGSLDTFAAGSLVALYAHKIPALSRLVKMAMAALALGLFALSSVLRHAPQDSLWTALVEVPESLCFAWLLIRLLDPTSWPSALLRWRPLVELGRLSYGIFVFHVLVSILFQPVVEHFGFRHGQGWTAVLLIGISVVVSAASFYLIEQPLLRWSKGFRPDVGALITTRLVPFLRRFGPASGA